MADDIDWKLSPGVGHTTCLDDPTCEGDRYIICARDVVAQDMSKSMDYLSCVDQLDGSWPNKNAACAPQVGIAASDVESCFYGDRADVLFKEASDYFWNYWGPGSTAVPRLMIGNQTFLKDYTTNEILQALCETGIQAAACSASPSPSPSPSPTPSPAPTPAGSCNFLHGYIPYDGSSSLGTVEVKYEQQCCDACKAKEGCTQALHKISAGTCAMYTEGATSKPDYSQSNYWMCIPTNAVSV